MRKSVFFTAIYCLACLCFSIRCFSQTNTDTVEQDALHAAVNVFHAAFGAQSPVYNGKIYEQYSPSIAGNAYFNDYTEFKPGTVMYDGLRYPVSMLYDLNAQLVVVQRPDQNVSVALLNEKLDSFDYQGHHFRHVLADTLLHNPGALRSGYYDQIYTGKLRVLVRRSKSIQHSAGGIESHFSYAQELYLIKDNSYYNAGTEGRVLDIPGIRKKELQQYIRSAHLQFRKNPEDTLVKLAAYFDQITQ